MRTGVVLVALASAVAADPCTSNADCRPGQLCLINGQCVGHESCVLECGKVVPHEWSGRNQGFLKCTEVLCWDGTVHILTTVPSCTPRDCPFKPGREILEKASAVQQRDASSQSACTTDSDCPDTHFCREVAFLGGLWCEDDLECWPKNSLGGRCGGHTGHCAENRCLSDFVCIDQVCSTGQECMLECGTSVPHGWTGRDQGFLRCREVRCNNGVLDLVRTVTPCMPRDCNGERPGREDIIP